MDRRLLRSQGLSRRGGERGAVHLTHCDWQHSRASRVMVGKLEPARDQLCRGVGLILLFGGRQICNRKPNH
jgi:hypothetical protein